MTINFPQGTVVVPQVDSFNDFNEVPLDANIIPITTTGTNFTNIGVSGYNIFSAVEDVSIAVNTPNFVQVAFTLGTDLLITENNLPLDVNSLISNGSGFTINSNSVTLSEIGIYKITWQVSGELAGSVFGVRRRNLVTDLNRNSGNFISATQTAGFATSVRTGPIATSEGSYIIETTSVNETVSIRSRDLSLDSTNSITFTLFSGYLKIERIKKI